jgi:large subunit ribosomal protein L1
MHGKIYKKTKEKVPAEIVDLTQAIDFVKENARKTFVETVELHVRLGVTKGKSEQMVRGSVVLPGGSPKQKRVLVFASGAAEQKAARDAGAVIVGGDELIAEIVAKGAVDADIAIATPDMMPKIAKVARVLGPKGLMPNPKTGTVSANPADVIKELSAGKLSFKMDQLGNIHEAVGKADWDTEKISANITAVLDAIRAARPAGIKGELIKTVAIKSTMGPAVKISR